MGAVIPLLPLRRSSVVVDRRRRKGRPAASLYFVRNSRIGIIKIGVAVDVEVRRRCLEFACGVPLELLSAVPNGWRKEEPLHCAFDAHRLIGEWFEPVPELVQLAQGDASIAEFLTRMDPVIQETRLRLEEARRAILSEHATRQAEQRWARMERSR